MAVDVGTSGARATAFSIEGEHLLEVRRSYADHLPRARLGGAGPAALAFRSDRGFGRPRPSAGIAPPVVAIGLTGQCPSVCLVDARANRLGRA